jgi:oxygen-dependent protoporphyrinogen oxidase
VTGVEAHGDVERGDVEVVVVGAGITGLALGRELASLGVPALTVEAAGRPGGVIRSFRDEGRVLDAGPQRTRLVDPVARLVEDLGLDDRLVEAPDGLPLHVYADGRLRRVPTSLRGWLGGDLLSWRGRLRLLAEPLTRSAREGETVEDWAVRRMGREVYERLVGPLYGGIYGSDPADMPYRLTLGRALERLGVGEGSLVAAAIRRMLGGASPPPAVSFRDGMEELPRALYREGRERIRLGTAARSLRRSGGGGWSVVTDDGRIRAAAVVLTCPADRAAAILEDVAPDAADRLATLRYNPLAVVHLLSDAGLEGFGYQVALSEGLVTRGVTFNESLFGRPGVYTSYLGGATAPAVRELPDGDVAEIAAREFRRVTGGEARAVRVTRTRSPAWDRSRERLEGMELPAGVRICAPYESRPGIPGRLEAARRLAGELADVLSGAAPGHGRSASGGRS